MSSTFPFLRLTHIPQQNVLGYLSVLDLFKFSLSSARAKKIAQAGNRSLTDIYLTVNVSYDKELTIHVWHLANILDFELFKCLIRMLQGVNEPVRENEVVIGWTEPTEESRMAAFERTVRHLQQVFHVEKLTLSFVEPFNLRNSFIWNLRTSPGSISMPKTRNNLLPHNIKFTTDNVKFALEELSIDQVSISGEIEPGYTCSAPLKTREVRLKTAQWLNLDAILSMTTEELALKDEQDPLSSREIRAIIKKWLSGGLGNLRRLTTRMNEEMTRNEELQERHVRRILEGFGELRRGDGKTAE